MKRRDYTFCTSGFCKVFLNGSRVFYATSFFLITFNSKVLFLCVFYAVKSIKVLTLKSYFSSFEKSYYICSSACNELNILNVPNRFVLKSAYVIINKKVEPRYLGPKIHLANLSMYCRQCNFANEVESF